MYMLRDSLTDRDERERERERERKRERESMYTVTYIHTNGTLNYPEHMSFNLFLHVAFFFYLGKKKKKKIQSGYGHQGERGHENNRTAVNIY